MRPRLIPELPLYATSQQPGDLFAGRADAIEILEGRAVTVLDWKSDIAPPERDMQAHVQQVRQYMAAADASRGLIVYMTLGIVRWVDGTGED
jgi:hypothetical protein